MPSFAHSLIRSLIRSLGSQYFIDEKNEKMREIYAVFFFFFWFRKKKRKEKKTEKRDERRGDER